MEAKEQLLHFIERIERVTEEKDSLIQDIKDIYLEAKSSGFDVKALREVIKLRAKPDHERTELEALVDAYKAAIGME